MKETLKKGGIITFAGKLKKYEFTRKNQKLFTKTEFGERPRNFQQLKPAVRKQNARSWTKKRRLARSRLSVLAGQNEAR